MKLSKHTVFYDLPAPQSEAARQAGYPGLPACRDDGGAGRGEVAGIAYNTRTQGILGLDKKTMDFLSTDYRLLTTTPEEREGIKILKDSGIIVDKEIDEDKTLDDWFEEIRFRPRPLHATILTTFKCNFACTYCFEESVKEQQTMNDQTADEVIEFLKAKAVEKGSPKIRLMFYGGEPLMNPAAIIRIATALQQWSNERLPASRGQAGGTKFSFGMITNGSLVRKEIITQLAKLGLTSIRITLDGDKEVHDKRRPFLDGRGTFDTIVRNIEEVLAASSDVTPAPSSVIPTPAFAGVNLSPRRRGVGIQDVPSGLDSSRFRRDGNDKIESLVKVELGANFDRDNIAGLHRLLDYLEQKGLNKRIARVLFAPVVSRLAGDEALTVEPVGCHKLSGELAEQGIKLEKELIQRGYNTPSSVKVSACPMTMDDSMLVIDPSGGLYKCEAFAGREQFCIGHVRERRFNRRYAEFLALKPWKECLDCPYVPMCGGGCRYIAQLKHSDYTKPACDKEYYEKIFPQLLKMDYERGVL